MAILQAQTSQLLPTGEYLMQLTDIQEIDGQFGPQFHMTFEVVKPAAFAGIQRQAWASVSNSLNGKILRWAAALYNRPIEEGESINTDNLIGRQAIAVVISSSREDGSEFNKIESLKPYSKQTPFASSAAAATQPPRKTDPFEDE